MKTSQKIIMAGVFAAAFALAGCASHGAKESSQPPAYSSGENSGINTTGSGTQQSGQAQSLSKAEQLKKQALDQHSIYFALDESTINPKYQVVVDNWAMYLLSDPAVKVQIQGNTDERGTRAYNQALGERRAEAVQSALEAEGVPASQLSSTSFGKERPVCSAHAESCWQLNRRADLVRR